MGGEQGSVVMVMLKWRLLGTPVSRIEAELGALHRACAFETTPVLQVAT